MRKVYTRGGDDGSTSLLFGGRVAKDGPGPTAYGATDEVVSALGLARAETPRGTELDELLIRLQRELFVVGAELATDPANRDPRPVTASSCPAARTPGGSRGGAAARPRAADRSTRPSW